MSTLSEYFREVSRFPLLTREQEAELGRRIKDNHDEQARLMLINCNLRLVIKIAKQFRSPNVPFEDLIQEGNIGLLTAVDKYDYTLGFKFSTCAVPWIRQAITN